MVKGNSPNTSLNNKVGIRSADWSIAKVPTLLFKLVFIEQPLLTTPLLHTRVNTRVNIAVLLAEDRTVVHSVRIILQCL